MEFRCITHRFLCATAYHIIVSIQVTWKHFFFVFQWFKVNYNPPCSLAELKILYKQLKLNQFPFSTSKLQENYQDLFSSIWRQNRKSPKNTVLHLSAAILFTKMQRNIFFLVTYPLFTMKFWLRPLLLLIF